MSIDELQPPHDHVAEQAVLGSLLIDRDAMFEIGDLLSPEMFHRRQHADIYRAMQALHARREPLDVVTVAGETPGETIAVMSYLAELLNAPESSTHVAAYARIVADMAARRALITLGGKLAKGAWDMSAPLDDTLTQAEAGLMTARNGRAVNPVIDAPDFTAAYTDMFLQSIANGDQTPRGVQTGLVDVDRMLIALQPPHQYILAGRPGMGKSAMALRIALNALRAGKRVLLFSLEMSLEQVTNRLISFIARIPVADIRKPWALDSTQRAAILAATGEISRLPLSIDETAKPTAADIHTRALKIYMERGLDLIIVDHINLVRPAKGNGRRVEELGEISQSLAATYKALHVPGLTLAQLNRYVEGRAVKRPMLSDLRDSGEVEETAYAVAFLYRPGAYDNTAPQGEAEFILAKHRDGETGIASLFWRGALMEYDNAAVVELNPAGSNGHYASRKVVT